MYIKILSKAPLVTQYKFISGECIGIFKNKIYKHTCIKLNRKIGMLWIVFNSVHKRSVYKIHMQMPLYVI